MSRLSILAGDCCDILPTLEAGSVQCCVTSPPYWGLRDYGTAEWEGGDAGCDHRIDKTNNREFADGNTGRIGISCTSWTTRDVTVKDGGNCLKCGARRIDSQLGLESTPEEYIANMVGVFRAVWRVLRNDGTLWVNLGDSYCSTDKWGGGLGGNNGKHTVAEDGSVPSWAVRSKRAAIPGLKPKDLCMMPARLAMALQADGWYLRSDIIWHKPNPMPESVTDRPTKAHEYIFLLTKSERYFYDAEAIREENSITGKPWGNHRDTNAKTDVSRNDALSINAAGRDPGAYWGNGRNKRSVWTIAEPEHVAKCPIDPAIVAALQADGWEIRVEPKPETVIDQPTRSHEYIFLLTKSAKYFYDAEAIREPAINAGRTVEYNGSQKNCSIDPVLRTRITSDRLVGENRNKRSVWTIATQPYAEAHFATFPEEIPKLCILAGSRVGDTVLDPFAGSGTVGQVALELGRRAILIELNPAYIELAEDRTFVTPGFL